MAPSHKISNLKNRKNCIHKKKRICKCNVVPHSEISSFQIKQLDMQKLNIYLDMGCRNCRNFDFLGEGGGGGGSLKIIY